MIMKTIFAIPVLVLLIAMFSINNVYAWDVYFDGSADPDAAYFGLSAWQGDDNNYLGQCTTQEGIYHLVDQNPVSTVRFYREGSFGLEYPTDLTVEARVKIVSASSKVSYVPVLGFGITSSAGSYVGLWTDKIGVRYGDSNETTFYSVDMTQYHTIRLATRNSDSSVVVWVDGIQALAGQANGGSGDGGVEFGMTPYVTDTADSYWDYVAYSKAYSPVPEPSTLLGFGSSLLCLAGFAIRKRSVK